MWKTIAIFFTLNIQSSFTKIIITKLIFWFVINNNMLDDSK